MASEWDPTVDIHMNARRRQGRPKTRWCDDLIKHVQQTDDLTSNTDDANVMTFPTPVDNRLWRQLAQDDTAWQAMEEAYCHH